ncbi:MAG: polymer-forming cytoskeletal protein [Elusimicrobia bacterium]|nr:polymer-forming cytoskeletal protein [Elusimicrobiota bacterium]
MFGAGSRAHARDGMTLIGEEAYFHGTLAAKGSLRVEGAFEGDITDASVVEIGAKGRVSGNVAAETVVVAGEIVGNVAASRSLELLAGARLRGDVRTAVLRVDEGACFDGSCAMDAARDAAEALP